jgi:hypothetical protein
MNFPMGKVINWITRGDKLIELRLYQKNWLTKASKQLKTRPRDHIRNVKTGKVGSSSLYDGEAVNI